MKIPRRFAAGVSMLLLIFLFITGCAPPVGHLSGGSAVFDELLAIPQRMVYDLGDEFKRETDLSVFVSYSGNLQPVPIDIVNIKIIEDVDSPEDTIIINGIYPMRAPGRKIVFVSYDSLSAKYSIEVIDPYGIGNGDSNGKGDTTFGPKIPWVYDK